MAPSSKRKKEEDIFEGFESSDGSSQASDAEPSAELAIISTSRKDRSVATTSKSADPNDDTNATTLYIGRVPHGFHEHEMRAYFSQFGTITRLRLSRNKHTGKSKHYAFLEFQDPYVARIAAATMDKYLLCGHILQCRLVPPAQVHPELWRGANRRYKVMPRNKMEGRKLNTARGREVWRERLNKERRRRREKGERLKALGFDYDFEPPRLMDVDSVEVRRITGGKEETKAIEEKGALEREDNDVAPEARPQESETIARVAVDVA